MEEVKAQTPKNTAIFYIKFIAIISVICAHCVAVNENVNRFTTICASILGRVGAIGVGCFLIISGALFNPNKQSFGFMMKKKLIKIGIPWLFGATVVYF